MSFIFRPSNVLELILLLMLSAIELLGRNRVFNQYNAAKNQNGFLLVGF